jgi:hypothetical protein
VDNEFEDKFDDKDIKNALNVWRESADKLAERPEWFWARQRARIDARMKRPKLLRMPGAAWAGIAATVALGVVLIASGGKPNNNQEPPKAKIEAQMSDHELMQQLELTMNSGVPDALQPASTLMQEMEQANHASTTSKVKERMQ